MRRLPAILLLLLSSYTLVAPLLLANRESQIAACCHRDGKHRCAKMAHADDGHSGQRIAGSRTCPLFPPGAAAPAGIFAAMPPPALLSFALTGNRPAPIAPYEARRGVSASRAWQKRGPPSLLA